MGFFPVLLSAQIVRIETNLGVIDVELNPEEAPITVENFLNYVNRGDYNNSIIHRIADDIDTGANFVVQGGGYFQGDETFDPIPADDPIVNELNLPNNRGTIAMAKSAGNIDSATSQWYFNTKDNPSLDDTENNGGYTTFGQVINGMNVVDLIGSLRIWTTAGGGDIGSIPLINYPGGETPVFDYSVQVINMAIHEAGFKINAGHSGAWYNTDTAGQGMLFEVLPESNLVFMSWFTFDTVAPPQDIAANVGAPEHRWLTGIGEINQETNTIVFDLSLTTGGLFDNPQPVMNSAPGSYGTVTAQINNCTDIDISYNLIDQDISGTFPMVRISDDNVSLCETLSVK